MAAGVGVPYCGLDITFLLQVCLDAALSADSQSRVPEDKPVRGRAADRLSRDWLVRLWPALTVDKRIPVKGLISCRERPRPPGQVILRKNLPAG